MPHGRGLHAAGEVDLFQVQGRTKPFGQVGPALGIGMNDAYLDHPAGACVGQHAADGGARDLEGFRDRGLPLALFVVHPRDGIEAVGVVEVFRILLLVHGYSLDVFQVSLHRNADHPQCEHLCLTCVLRSKTMCCA